MLRSRAGGRGTECIRKRLFLQREKLRMTACRLRNGGRVRGDHRAAAGERLRNGKTETFVGRRRDQCHRARVERGQLAIVNSRKQANVGGEHQSVRFMPPAAQEKKRIGTLGRCECRKEQWHVLVFFGIADVEKVGPIDLQPRAQCIDGGGQCRRKQRVHSFARDGTGGECAVHCGEIVADECGRDEEVAGGANGMTKNGAVGHAGDDPATIGIAVENQIMDRRDKGNGTAQRDEKVRREVKVCSAGGNMRRKAQLFGERVVPFGGEDGCPSSGGKCVQPWLRALPDEQGVLQGSVQRQEMLHDCPCIAAEPRVLSGKPTVDGNERHAAIIARMTLQEAIIASAVARADAEVLLAALLQVGRTAILAHPERQLTPAQQERWEEWAARRRSGEPVAFITGSREFWGRSFRVSPATLIPRPATEGLIARALSLYKKSVQTQCKTWTMHPLDTGIVAAEFLRRDAMPPLCVDIGTGSGCIAVTLAAEVPSLRVLATDISAEALHVARQNAKHVGVAGRVIVRRGALFNALPTLEEPFFLISNPPYIPDGTPLQRDVAAFEPHTALFAGVEGMDVLEPLVAAALAHPLCTGLLVECREEQAVALSQRYGCD